MIFIWLYTVLYLRFTFFVSEFIYLLYLYRILNININTNGFNCKIGNIIVALNLLLPCSGGFFYENRKKFANCIT